MSGFESDTVTSAFAEMLNLPPDEAEAIVTSRFVVEKEVELHVAKTCKEKLAKIGVDALLKRHGGVGELSLAPMGEDDSPDEDGNELPGSEIMVCPKCDLKQERADCCSECGVYIHKIIQQAADTEASRVPGAITAAEVAEPAVVVAEKKPHKRGKATETQPWLMPVTAVAGVAVLGFLAFNFLL